MKKIIKFLLVLIVLGVIGYFGYKYFDIGKYFEKEKKSIKKEEPVLQIFDEDSNTRVIGVSINNNH